jgi:TP901 family phage tail tape measure protein
MALRFGEMVLVVRTQDFASRNLHRISGELHSMSRQQRAFNAVQQHNMRITKQQDRIGDLRQEQGRLRTVRESIAANNKLTSALNAQAIAQKRVNTTKGGFSQGKFTAPTRQYGANLAQLANADKALASATKNAAMYEAQLAALGPRYQNLTRDSTALDDRITKTTRNLRDARIESKLLAQESAALAFATKRSTMQLERMLGVGHAMGRIGRVMQLTGLAGTAAFGLMAKSAADFDSSLTLAASQARDINAPLSQIAVRSKQIGNAILQQMQQFPASQTDMAAAAYEIFSSMNLERNGIIDVAKGLDYLRTANKAAVAGQGTLADATNAMITVVNDFGKPLGNNNKLLNTMFSIIRFGRMHIAEFNQMMNDVAPGAKAVGNSLEDVGGAMAYLTTVMPSQSRVGVGIRRLLEALRNPTIVKGMRDWGIEALRVDGTLKPLPTLIKDIVRTFPGLKTGQRTAQEFFSAMYAEGKVPGRKKVKGVGREFTAQGRNAFTFLVQGSDQYLAAQNRVRTNTEEFNKSYAALMASQGNQWKVLVNQMKAMAIVIGQEALPVFLRLMQSLAGVAQWFRNLSPHTRHMIVQWATIAAVSILVIGIFNSIAGALISLISILSLFVSKWIYMRNVMAATTAVEAGGGVAATFGAIAASAAAAIVPLLALTAAVVALGYAFGPTDKQSKDWFERNLGFVKWGRDKLGISDADYASAKVKKDILAMQGKGMGKVAISSDEYGFKKLQGHLDHLNNKELTTFYKKIKELPQGVRGPVRAVVREIAKLRNIVLPEPKKKVKVKTFAQLYNEALKTVNIKSLTAAQKKQMEEFDKLMNQVGASTDNLADRQKKLGRAMKDAWDQEFKAAQDRLEQAASAMAAKYKEIEGQNQQMWGTLFKGPVLTSETFNIAKEWGINPALRNINDDIDATNKRFTKFRNNLGKLRKKGVPQSVIDEIAAMGAEEGMAWTDAILKGSPKDFQKFLAVLKTRKTEIQKATQLDFKRVSAVWYQAGKAGADAFMAALNDPNIGLTNFFKNKLFADFPTYAADAAKAAAAAAGKAFNDNNPIPTKAVDKGGKNRNTPPPKKLSKDEIAFRKWMAVYMPKVKMREERPQYDWRAIWKRAKNNPAPSEGFIGKLMKQWKTQYTLKDPKWKKGMIEQGNIDILHRPRVKNKDGSWSSVKSASFGIDGQEVLLPKVWKGLGRVATNAEALAHYYKTGMHLGKFKTEAAANAYAAALHNQQAGLTKKPRTPGLPSTTFDPFNRTTQIAGNGITNNDYSTTINVKGEFNTPEKAKETARKIAFAQKNRKTQAGRK